MSLFLLPDLTVPPYYHESMTMDCSCHVALGHVVGHEQCEVGPGEVLYIPAFYWHEVQPSPL